LRPWSSPSPSSSVWLGDPEQCHGVVVGQPLNVGHQCFVVVTNPRTTGENMNNDIMCNSIIIQILWSVHVLTCTCSYGMGMYNGKMWNGIWIPEDRIKIFVLDLHVHVYPPTPKYPPFTYPYCGYDGCVAAPLVEGWMDQRVLGAGPFADGTTSTGGHEQRRHEPLDQTPPVVGERKPRRTRSGDDWPSRAIDRENWGRGIHHSLWHHHHHPTDCGDMNITIKFNFKLLWIGRFTCTL
jgi:hypothetical protein